MKNGNGALKIDKGIPIPKPHRSGLTAALRSMKPGDSVVFEGTSQGATNVAYQAFHGKGYVAVRKIDAMHVRVWRIK